MPINLSMTFNYYTQFAQNPQKSLIVNIRRSDRNSTCVLFTLNTIAALCGSWYGTHFIASCFIGPGSVTEHAMLVNVSDSNSTLKLFFEQCYSSSSP